MLKANHGENRLRDAGEKQGSDKGPRDSAGEGEMVVCGGQARSNIAGGRAIDKYVVGGLDVERLLDFCIRGDNEMDQDSEWDE
jgi:hypothetical protein